MTKIAVVILNYNGEKLLQQFLPSVVLHSPEAEVIIADNGSTDQSLTILQEKFPNVRLIQLDKNYGFCGGYNRALKQVKATYYVLLNSDIEVTAGWLKPMIQLLESNDSIVAVQPKILAYHQKGKFEYAGAAGGFIDSLGYPYCRGRIFSHVEEDAGQYNDEREIFWATGACLFIQSEVFHRFGGFDEDLFAHMEEIDLCWKINRTGQKVYYCGKSTIYHVGAGTLAYDNPRKTYFNFRNGLTLIFKHLDTVELCWKLPLRLFLDWVAGFSFLLKGQPQNLIAVLKSQLYFVRNFKRARMKRRELRAAHPTYSRSNIHTGLIIFDYYFKQKTKFSNPR